MAELRQSLHTLVERPPAPPVAVEAVAARGARYARRRRVQRAGTALVLVAVASAAGSVVGRDREQSGVVLSTHGATQAGYVAEEPGGYIGTGTWTLRITRGGEVIELSSTSTGHCGRTGVILPGDEVRGSITGSNSTLRVGNDFSCPE